jgi:hypothetical protein
VVKENGGFQRACQLFKTGRLELPDSQWTRGVLHKSQVYLSHDNITGVGVAP